MKTRSKHIQPLRVPTIQQPVEDQVPTIQWVEDQIATRLSIYGGTLSGSLFLYADPTEDNEAATKHYVDSKTSTAISISFDPYGNILETNVQEAIEYLEDAKINKAGDTMEGPLILARDPELPKEAATKDYVDQKIYAKEYPFTADLMIWDTNAKMWKYTISYDCDRLPDVTIQDSNGEVALVPYYVNTYNRTVTIYSLSKFSGTILLT